MKAKVNITVEGPFVISSRAERPESVHAFPHVWKSPQGVLFLSMSKDRDVCDAGRFLLESADQGRTWRESKAWPTAISPGMFCPVDRKTTLACFRDSFATEQDGIYEIPAWFSKDGGNSWGPMETCTLQMPHIIPIDIYDPPEWWRKQNHVEIERGFVKAKPPDAMMALFERYSRKRSPGIYCAINLGANHLLGLVIFPVDREKKLSVAAVESIDGGRHWRFLSMVARYDDCFSVDELMLCPREVDGFDEPAIVKLPDGEILVIMRMGSYHPLYSVKSKDNGKSWTEPVRLSVRGVLPSAILLQNGAVVMSTGRPDATLNVSLDKGASWPYQVKLWEETEGKCSTSNTSMIDVAANKILYVHDSFSRDEQCDDWWLRSHGHGEILGYFISVDAGRHP
ncbi:MAG: sialidase family protein [Kiritimatiellaeota bacterium]|nr:sialidase family protein [Kiritimatiellota bacterium]